MFMGYSFYQLFLIFIFWGIVGWLIEVIDMRIEAGEFQNRGFLHMPFCPIYGFGMAVASAGVSGMKHSYLALFVFGMVFCSALEYVVGGILEALFHSKWWDYSHMRFHIKGRVCLRNALLFGFGSVLVFRVVEPVVEQVIALLPVEAGFIIIVMFSIALVFDVIFSAKRAWSYRQKGESRDPMLVFKAHK